MRDDLSRQPAARPQPGARLGPYEVGDLLGAGGMGEVYRGRDLRLGREVAIKVLPADVGQDPGRLRRFEQEARSRLPRSLSEKVPSTPASAVSQAPLCRSQT